MAPELRYARRAMSTTIQRHHFTVYDYRRMGESGILAENWVADLHSETILAHTQPANGSCSLVRRFHRGRTLASVLLPGCTILAGNLLA